MSAENKNVRDGVNLFDAANIDVNIYRKTRQISPPADKPTRV